MPPATANLKKRAGNGNCAGSRPPENTMVGPSETEAGSAGMHPCRGIAWRAHRHDDQSARKLPFRALQNSIGEIDPDALKIPARRAESTLTEIVSSPFPAEPEQIRQTRQSSSVWTKRARFRL